MKYGYGDKKQKLTHRLNRAEGQMRGIAKMIENDTYCIDILTQIGAVQSALDKVALELLDGHAESCLADGSLSEAQRKDKAKELVHAIGRMLPR